MNTRQDLDYPGIVRGTLEFYRWYQCTGCGQMVNGDDDPGRWRSSDGGAAWCRQCQLDGKAGTFKPKHNGPLKSMVPRAYATATIEQIVPVKLGTFLKLWPHKRKFMVLCGPASSGKTHASWAVEKFCCLNRVYARHECGMSLRSYWAGMPQERRYSLLQSMCEASNLILDALTDGDATEGWTQFIHELLNERFAHARPTLITTMHDAVEIGTGWGNAIRDRLAQYSWVKLPPTNWRERTTKA